jgi:hypothetical protein
MYPGISFNEECRVTLQVGEFKAHFSDILKKVENSEEFIISFGKQKQKVVSFWEISFT